MNDRVRLNIRARPLLLLVGGLMLVLAFAGIELSRHSGRIASVWLANGAVLAILLRQPRHAWPALLGSAFIGNVAANLLSGDALLAAIGLSLCNIAEIVIVGMLVGPTTLARAFAHPAIIYRFALAALLACSLSAAGAILVLSPGMGEIAPLFRRWLLADALGLLMVTPLALAWMQQGRATRAPQHIAETLAYMALAFVTTTAVMRGPAPLLFTLAPVLLFAGFRLRPVAASLVGLVSATVAIVLTVRGLGPIAAAPVGEEGRTLLVQAYVSMCFLLTLPISTATQERDQLVTDLADSEERHRMLAENSSDIIARIGLDGTIHYVSGASRHILGYAPEAVVGVDAGWTIHESDRSKVRAIFMRACRGQVGQMARYRQRRADGAFVWLEAAYNLAARDGRQEIIATIRDIDRRRRAELVAADAAAKLRESNRMLSMAEDMAAVGHWRFDVKGDTFDSSHSARRIAGITSSRALDPADLIDRFEPADRPAVRRLLVRARAGERQLDCRARIRGDDGLARPIKLGVLAVRDSTGAMTGLFGIICDIREKVASEKRLIAARDEARAAAEAKSAFLATMSHEIRTPMTGVLGMIELLRGPTDERERAHYLDTLKQSADLLMAVLNDVLDFSKIEHGAIDLRPDDFDMERLARSTLDLFFNAASSKGLLIGLEIDAGATPLVRGDPIRLQQVMSNLINNAIKFTERGSVRITIRASGDAAGRRNWRIEVRDSGIGIPAGQLDTLFDPFTQADNGDLRRFGGTGLGLAISRRLIEAMGGAIGVTSTLGEGSMFWIELPLDPASAPIAQGIAARPATPPAEARPLAVLVAEDNPVNQLLVSALLKRLGHRPTLVANGHEAVEIASDTAFDCILMDMQMPVMDGISATRAIRSGGGPSAAVPIIALTADASPERRRFYDQAGLTGFMTKPIDVEALRSCLATIPAERPAALDPAHLDRLRGALGDARLQSLLDLFATELDRRPAMLRQLAAAADLDGLAAEAHSLKGAALSIGAGPLAEATRLLEEHAMEGRHAAAPGAVEAVLAAIDDARAALDPPPVARAGQGG